MHISNIFKEDELEQEVVCKDSLLTTQHGAIEWKTQAKLTKIYNLDVIQLQLAIQKHASQYPPIAVSKFSKSHDRFLIIDKGEAVYHIGASLKDLGKKWFAFSKMNRDSVASIVSTVAGLM